VAAADIPAAVLDDVVPLRQPFVVDPDRTVEQA
jgi:hypothetical protein